MNSEKTKEVEKEELEIDDGGPPMNKRETWSTKFDFVLACIGFSVGLGNVWRFPYLCYKNGGGAFLIPYFICVVVGGVPLFYLEVAVGQFMGVSGLGAWGICPILRGIGIATTIIVFFLNCYYNVILCWAFYYMFSSFTLELPWATCDNWWNTDRCSLFTGEDDKAATNTTNTTTTNNTMMNMTNMNMTTTAASTLSKLDPVTEFWERKVLDISSGIEEMGPVKWDLALTLLFAWIVVYFCICKGIRSSGKVMYVTATSPYIFMTILLIKNSTLDGALEGVKFYVIPDFEKLKEIEVWVDAGTQIFFSYSISLGALTALGSYNKFKHNSYRDAIIFACFNSGTSIFAGFLIFTILGHVAHIQDTTVDKVAASGPGLAFIAYPKAVSLMPGAPAWSVLFFLMVVLLGLDSQFVGVEGVITAIVDQWPHILRRGYRKEIFIGCVCFVNFLIGLSMVAEGGMYVFQLFDYYSGSRIILFVAFFQCVAIAWIYGVRRFYDNIESMLGFRINYFMAVNWTILSPIFCMSIFVMSAINYSELDYKRTDGLYVYPQWAVAIGWSMAGLSAIFIPLMAIYPFVKYGFTAEVFWLSLKPYGLKGEQLRPQDVGERTLADLDTPKTGQRQQNIQYMGQPQKKSHDNPAFQGKIADPKDVHIGVNKGYEADVPTVTKL